MDRHYVCLRRLLIVWLAALGAGESLGSDVQRDLAEDGRIQNQVPLNQDSVESLTAQHGAGSTRKCAF